MPPTPLDRCHRSLQLKHTHPASPCFGAAAAAAAAAVAVPFPAAHSALADPAYFFLADPAASAAVHAPAATARQT